MTDNEIIKALECCLERNSWRDPNCYECPFDGTNPNIGCKKNLLNNALDLINRKKAEIERLQSVNADVQESLRLAAEANKDMQAEVKMLREAKVVFETVDHSLGDLEDALEEIDRLKIENDSLRTAGNSLKMRLKKAKEEIEGLKNKIEHLVCFLVEVRIDATKEFIDNRIKELTEEKK